jgi:hypothetical protein
MAKGYNMIKSMDNGNLLKFLESREEYLEAIGENYRSSDSREVLEEKALMLHTYPMIAELFGKAHGYCRGVGGGMHIADFELWHLGANAIVGGHVPIAPSETIFQWESEEYSSPGINFKFRKKIKVI